MPYRKTPIAIGQVYHVYNRSIARQPIFLTNRDYQRGLETFAYYSYIKPSLRFSHYNRLPQSRKFGFLHDIQQNHPLQIKILAFSLMPNHLHLVIEEVREQGISIFMRKVQNSYA